MAVSFRDFIVGHGYVQRVGDVAKRTTLLVPPAARRTQAPPSRSTSGCQFAEAAFGGADFARLGTAFGGGGQGFAGRVEVACLG